MALPPGRLRLATRPNLTGSVPAVKTIGIVVVAALAANAAGSPPLVDDDRYMSANQIGRHFRQPIVLTFRPTEFDRQVATLDVAHFPQAFAVRSNEVRERRRRCATEKPDYRHRRLLPVRGERPKGRGAAEERDELAPSHELSSKKADNLAHRLTAGALCIAAEYSCLCRFRSFALRLAKGDDRSTSASPRKRPFKAKVRNGAMGQQETFGAELRHTAANPGSSPLQAEDLPGPTTFAVELLVASLPTRGGFSGGNGFARSCGRVETTGSSIF